MQQPQRDAGIGRMPQAALALNEQDLARRICVTDQRLRGACQEIRDDAIDRDAFARDHDAGLSGGDELAPDTRRGRRRRSKLAVILPTAQSLPTVRTVFCDTCRLLPENSGRSSGGWRTSHRRAPVRARPFNDLDVVCKEAVQTVGYLQTPIHGLEQPRTPVLRDPSSRSSDPQEQRGAAQTHRALQVPHHRRVGPERGHHFAHAGPRAARDRERPPRDRGRNAEPRERSSHCGPS